MPAPAVPSPIVQGSVLFAAAFAAGAVNSVAGGGSLITFPMLLWAGVPAIAANATNTVALVPGSASSCWAYRSDLGGDARTMLALALPSAAGGAAGAVLAVRAGDSLFSRLVPWLILAATALFIAQGPLARYLRTRPAADDATAAGAAGAHPPRLLAVALFQFFVAVYGGFFGAGIGILMLAALGLAGMTNLHRMNGLKNFAAVCINGVAAVTFAAGGHVRWPLAALMAVGAIAGGLGGAGVARRVGQDHVRRAIIAVGLSIAAVMFYRQIRP